MTTTIAIIIALIVGLILGRASVKVPVTTHNLDTPRLDYLESTKQSAFYNDTAQAWAVLDTAGKPIRASMTLRGAVDQAKAQANG